MNTANISPTDEDWALSSERATDTILAANSEGSVSEDNVTTDDPANIQDHLQSLQQVLQTTNPIKLPDFRPVIFKCRPSECNNSTLMGLSSQLDVLCFGDASNTYADPDFTMDSSRFATFRWLSELGRSDYSLECEMGGHQDRWFQRTLSLSNYSDTALPNLICNSRIYGDDSMDPTALVFVRDTGSYDLEGGNEDDNTCTDTSCDSTFDAQAQLLQLDISSQAVTTPGRAPTTMAGGVIGTFNTPRTQLPSVNLPDQTENVHSRQSRVHDWSPIEALSTRWPHPSVDLDMRPACSSAILLPPWPQGQQSELPQDSSRVVDDAQHNSTVERPGHLDREGFIGKVRSRERLPRNSLRSDQDHFLVISKLSGMSYKEIKVKGRFKEAESTLRGRFRTLTKSKESRVRKPHWHDKDVSFDAPASYVVILPFTD